jgi:hypothetical protein
MSSKFDLPVCTRIVKRYYEQYTRISDLSREKVTYYEAAVNFMVLTYIERGAVPRYADQLKALACQRFREISQITL